MIIRRIRGAPRALALLTLLALLVVAPVRAFQPVPVGDTADGWKKVLEYARCAVLVYTAVVPAAVIGAILACHATFEAEPPINWGGGS